MKKKKIVVNLLILLTVMSCFLSGCGSTPAEPTPAADEGTQAVTEEETTEKIESTAEQDTSATQEETETTQEETEIVEDQAPSSPMVDWETFAAQEDSEDICIVISNEAEATQRVIYEEGCYVYTEGDKIAIPIRDSIYTIQTQTAKTDGSLNDDTTFIYDKSKSSSKYVEFEIGDKPGYYYIFILCETENTLIYTLYKSEE